MAFSATLRLGIFRFEKERHRSEAALYAVLRALVKIDCGYLLANPKTLPLYHSGVVYKREPEGVEEFRDIPTLLEAGNGDCEDLACWRAAELIVRKGVNARPVLSHKQFRVGGVTKGLYHVRVMYPNGKIEDPSAILGMNG